MLWRMMWNVASKSRYSSMLTSDADLSASGGTIPAHLLCCAGFAVCLYSFTPRVAHLGRTCRVNNPG